jgi:hypothetical protein
MHNESEGIWKEQVERPYPMYSYPISGKFLRKTLISVGTTQINTIKAHEIKSVEMENAPISYSVFGPKLEPKIFRIRRRKANHSISFDDFESANKYIMQIHEVTTSDVNTGRLISKYVLPTKLFAKRFYMGVRSVGNGWGRQARDLPPMDFLKNSPN